MIQNERDCRHEHVLDVARQMLTAARTAPKGKGIDVIEAALVTGEDIKKLSEKMVAMIEEHGMKFFLRDADNILQCMNLNIETTAEMILFHSYSIMPHSVYLFCVCKTIY